jgi:ubiquinone/menaquinone biosynthesis C-methylase UbiE
MPVLENNYPESKFGGYSDIDGTIVFYSRINAIITPEMTVLDVGCGRGSAFLNDKVGYRRSLRNFKGKVKSVIGIDVDSAGKDNPGLNEFRLLVDKNWPIESQSIDLIVSDFVLEHIQYPQQYFTEVSRVLKPGGIFCARTTNKIGYVGIVARLVFNKNHAKVLSFIQKDRAEVDIFPTVYNVNTVFKLKKILSLHSMMPTVYGYDAEPSYFTFSRIMYRVARWFQYLTPQMFKTCIFIFARKL